MTVPEPRAREPLRRLEAWLEAEDFSGWDPFDALNSPLLRALSLGSRRLGIVWVQLLKRSPFNLRPLLGVRRGRNPKGIGLFAAAYLRRWWVTGDPASRGRVGELTDWLREHRSGGWAGACWGYNFPWPNRGFYAPAGMPTVVNTAFIAGALLEAGDVATARSACDFVLRDLNRLEPAPDELCFSYTPEDRRWIYNASLLGGELLARVHAETGEAELAEAAARTARFVARRQQADGSWRYGVDAAMDGWVDNFHTGFVLCSFQTIRRSLRTVEFDDEIAAGYRYWKDHMFREDGAPRYYADRDWPIDVHAVAQAILTFLAFADEDRTAGDRARQMAGWAVDNLQDPRGFFHYRLHRRFRIRIPYIRWSQAWMHRALWELEWHEAGRPTRAAHYPVST